MDALYLERLKKHLNNRYKHLRYLLNDHMLLIGFILLVCLAYIYSDILRYAHELAFLVVVVLSAGWMILLLHPIQVATLLQEQDIYYLNHTTVLTKRYFMSAKVYSSLFVAVAWIVGTMTITPFLRVQGISLGIEWFLCGIFVCMAQVLVSDRVTRRVLSVGCFVMLVLFFYYPYVVLLSLLATVLLVYSVQNKRLSIPERVSIEYARQARQLFLLRFFVDGRLYHETPKKQWWEGVFSMGNKTPLLAYVLRRRDIRDVIIGQMIIGLVISLVSQNRWIISAFFALLLCLTAMQIDRAIDQVMSRLYRWMPKDGNTWLSEKQTVMLKVCMLQMVCLMLVNMVFQDVLTLLYLLISGLLVRFVALPLYISIKLDKMKK